MSMTGFAQKSRIQKSEKSLGLALYRPRIQPHHACPTFLQKAKASELTDVNKLQALYDGALGARAMHELRSYVDPDTAFDNNAYTITSTYHPSGLLAIHTTHPTPSGRPKIPIKYRMTQLRSFAMTDAPHTFRQGAGFLRNPREWAEEKWEELITAANSKMPDAEGADLDKDIIPTTLEMLSTRCIEGLYLDIQSDLCGEMSATCV